MRTFNNTFNRKNELAVLLIMCFSLLSGCGGSKSSSADSTAPVGTTEAVIAGTATKGPIDAATVTAYALNSNGQRGEYLGMTTTGRNGAFSLPVKHQGAVSLVVTGGSYTDEASGIPVSLPAGVELETLLSSVDGKNSVAITALTTIASVRARENASVGLAVAIAAANKQVADVFGLVGIDIAATIPSDLTSTAASQDSSNARKYGLVQAGLTQLAADRGMQPIEVLDLVRQMSNDFGDGRFDGKNNRGTAIEFAMSITPHQALAGLQQAMAAFLESSENKSGDTTTDVEIPEVDGALTGQATKGPIAGGTVNVYRLSENGSRGELLASTLSDAKGNFSVPLDVTGPVAVVVTGGTYKDEATGISVSLNESELETLIPDGAQPANIAITALTTIAAKRASANASVGLSTAIASANAEVAALFGLGDVNITSTIPADLTNDDSAGEDAGAQAYGLVQSALSQLIETNAALPEQLLTLIRSIAADYTDGTLDGVDSANEPIELALSITPIAAITGLENARRAFLDSSENASKLVEIPIPADKRP